jgi:cobyrinic acid a,c-diamide synthase
MGARLALRPSTLDGKVLGLVSNNRPRSEELLQMVADVLKEQFTIKAVVELNKERHQWPASPEALQKLATECDVAIHATAE